jgi:hypothetical protein
MSSPEASGLSWITFATVPIGTNGVDHPASREVPGAGRDCFADRKATRVCVPPHRSASLEQSRTGRAVDGTVDATPTQQGGIGRVDNRVDLLLGDVTADRFQSSLRASWARLHTPNGSGRQHASSMPVKQVSSRS